MKPEEMIFAVLGGDARQLWLAKGLLEQGYGVRTLDVPGAEDDMQAADPEQALRRAEAVILPMPAFDDETCITGTRGGLSLKRLLAGLEPQAVVYGGRLTGDQKKLLEDGGHPAVDYGRMEQLAAANAVPTAEGAILIAMQELPVTLWKSRCLVLGFGRVGKVLSLRLRDLGAQVTVTARKPADLALIRALGMDAAVIGPEILGSGNWDLVVNTIPAIVLGHGELKCIKGAPLILDLASKPGGVDRKAAELLGRKVVWALGLPGKTAPATAGRIVMEAVLEHWINRKKGWGE